MVYRPVFVRRDVPLPASLRLPLKEAVRNPQFLRCYHQISTTNGLQSCDLDGFIVSSIVGERERVVSASDASGAYSVNPSLQYFTILLVL